MKRTVVQFQWCNKDPRCKKLQLTDLLVSPVHHIMKVHNTYTCTYMYYICTRTLNVCRIGFTSQRIWNYQHFFSHKVDRRKTKNKIHKGLGGGGISNTQWSNFKIFSLREDVKKYYFQRESKFFFFFLYAECSKNYDKNYVTRPLNIFLITPSLLSS